jgi:hypothetical protein
MDDEGRRVLEDEGRQRELSGAGLPERRDPLVEDAMCEEAADDAVLALHEVEVAVTVATTDGHARDEVVQDEVVEHDDAWPTPQRVDDPRVRIRVVADVVQADIRAARRALATAPNDLDVDPLS